MKKGVVIAIPAIILILGAIFIYHQQEMGSRQVCFPESCITAEVADDNHERAKGLMFRTTLPEDKGMLFIFEESGEYSFWMKNTLIPLDIIWLNKDKFIVDIKESAQPCEQNPCPSYRPESSARYILETNSGYVQEHGIKIGDKVDF